MANPLYAIALAAAVSALAEPAREHPFILGLKSRLAEAFIEAPQERLLDVSGQRQAALEAGATDRQFDALLDLAEDARAIQLGRRHPEESPDVFNRAVMDVARHLGARTDHALRNYGARVRPAGAGTPEEIEARIRVLTRVNAQLGPQGQRRMAQRLRGYRLALEDLNRRGSGTGTGTAPGALGSFGGYQPVSFVAASAPSGEQGYMAASLVAAHALTPEQYRALNAQRPAQTPPLRPGEVPDEAPDRPEPQPSTVAWLYDTVLEYLDQSRIVQLSREMGRRAVGFIGSCYAYVKQGLINSGFFPSSVRGPTEVTEVGIGSASAYMFALLTPQQLEARGLRRVRPSTIPWAPMNDNLNGFILVWGPGCNGFHAEHGHIEVIRTRSHPEQLSQRARDYLFGNSRRGIPAHLQNDELIAISDGATGRAVSTLQRFSREPQRTVGVRDHRGARHTINCLTVLAPVAMP